MGTVIGVVAVLVVALARTWTAVMSPTLTLLASLLRLVVGRLAGLDPAMRTARIEPNHALRH